MEPVQATLIAHCGATRMSRDELKTIPVPESTRTFKPIPHHEIVGSLVEALGFRYIGVVRDEYAVSPDGMKMFGVLDLETQFDGCRFAIGIRNANDRSMRLGITVVTAFFPEHLNARLIAQEGCFLSFPLPENRQIMKPPLVSTEGVDELRRFTIPRAAKARLRKQLGFLGINHRSFFPGLDGISVSIQLEL
jgi:hypothetical protein